jgi:hypothetical protein
VVGVGALLLLAPPALACWRLTTLRAHPDTSELAARWVVAHVKPETERVILVPFIDLPLQRTREAVVVESKRGWRSPWMIYLASLLKEGDQNPCWDLRGIALNDKQERAAVLADPVGWMRASGARYAMIEVPTTPEASVFHNDVLASLARDAELVLRIPASARGEIGEPVLSYEDLPHPRHVNWIWGLLTRFEVFGRTIAVYRIP